MYWNWEDENGGSPNTCTLMANYVEDIFDQNFIGGNSECNKISKLISSYQDAYSNIVYLNPLATDGWLTCLESDPTEGVTGNANVRQVC